MAMNKPKRFIECLLPVTICNLKCDYCYIIQENRRGCDVCELNYSIHHIAKALSPSRLGGICYINICGSGETLIPPYIVDLVNELLKEGHYISITTNGTLTKRFDEFVNKINPALLKHLHFAFSFHYLELLKNNLIDTFFNNITKVSKNGCSFVCQLNLYDDYFNHVSKIKKICVDKIGAFPQVAVTRNESFAVSSIMTDNLDNYIKIGKSFNSKLFDFTYKNFNVKRNEFCYAGDWSFLLNLKTGEMRKCYHCEKKINIFENLDKPINFEAIGRNCKHQYCVNSSHFMSLGIIPSIKCETYAELRNRKEAYWYQPEMDAFLSSKLGESNSEYSFWKRFIINLKNKNEMSFKRRIKEKYWSFINFISESKQKRKLNKVINSNSNKTIYCFSQYPHSNIGDAAIFLAQQSIIKKAKMSSVEIDPNLFKTNKILISKKLNNSNSLIALQGGGNIGTLWEAEESHRRLIIESLPLSNILIFPQSIFFESKDEILKSIYYYNRKNITIMLRDKKSYEFCLKYYPNANSILCTDIVFSLKFPKKRKTNVPLLILRCDKEKDPKYEKDIEIAKKLVISKGGTSIDMYSGYSLTPGKRKKAFKKLSHKFSKSSFVVTDRLHAMVFSAMTDTPCIVFDNIYGKIQGVIETSGIKNLNLVKSFDGGIDFKNKLCSVDRIAFERMFVKIFKDWVSKCQK